MLRHHKGMSSSTSATDAQAKLLHSVKCETSAADPSGDLVLKSQVTQLLTAQSTKAYHGALLVVMNRNPLSYYLLGL